MAYGAGKRSLSLSNCHKSSASGDVDFGTGTCVWAAEFSKRDLSFRVIGIDLLMTYQLKPRSIADLELKTQK